MQSAVNGGPACVSFYRKTAVFDMRLLTLLHGLALVIICAGQDTPPPSYGSLYGRSVGLLNAISSNLIQLPVGFFKFLRESFTDYSEGPEDFTPSKKRIFDFIVVGAGTAGATIASRLSEIEDNNVLLIEAGADEHLYMDVPLTVSFLQLGEAINWAYETEPSDKYCLGMDGKKCRWARGKVMGGSSVLNYMMAGRGTPEDYDRWASMGNDGWSYKDVLPYFKKLETMTIEELAEDEDQHGREGPVPISQLKFHTPLAEGFMKAAAELGYPRAKDVNGKDVMGFTYVPTTIKDGIRWSSNRAYLKPVKGRRNLFISKNSLASKVIFDRDNKRAIGVKFMKNGQIKTAFARKEVILCAGAIGSPQLLMLSGIGPADHLNSLGINVVKDLPVGDNLMDHIAYGGLVFLVDHPVGIRQNSILNFLNPYVKDFFMDREGPLTVPGSCEVLGFIDVDNPNSTSGVPNIELLFMSASYCSGGQIERITGLSQQTFDLMCRNNMDKDTWTVFPLLVKPKSRGWIRLKSDDVNVKPKIVANYLNDTEDVRLVVKGIKAAIDISKTQAMQKFGSRLHKIHWPQCKNFKYDSDEYWECAARTITTNIYHYSGTCKMGPKNDSTAVVDSRLRVIGIEGLRVADASIMPEIVSGHTNIPVYMIGEKLADMVKKDWGYRKNPIR